MNRGADRGERGSDKDDRVRWAHVGGQLLGFLRDQAKVSAPGGRPLTRDNLLSVVQAMLVELVNSRQTITALQTENDGLRASVHALTAPRPQPLGLASQPAPAPSNGEAPRPVAAEPE